MQVIGCKRCGKLFQHIQGPRVCEPCKKVEEEIFQEVKEFLRENKGATMEQVSENTRASMAQIQKFLREGRLEVTEGSPIVLNCEKCGKVITKGRLCNKCNENIRQGLEQALGGMQAAKPAAKPASKNRMHFINK